MFKGFQATSVQANGLRIHTIHGGVGPPLLLLHGYPQTHAMWHKVAPRLAQRFTLVLTDLRGYGASDKPPGDPRHETYSKRVMAADQVAVMRALGFERFHVVGHDRGGRVVHRLCLDHPEAVISAAVLDIAPTATMFARTDMTFATAYYHWFFLIQPFDLPERLIGADPAYYLRKKLAAWARNEGAFEDAAVEAYIRAFSDPAAIHASCEDYRAAATIDLEHDAAGAARPVACPLLVLWGAKGFLGTSFDVLATWREKAEAVKGRGLPCGHFLAEEAPDETAGELEAFFSETAKAVRVGHRRQF